MGYKASYIHDAAVPRTPALQTADWTIRKRRQAKRYFWHPDKGFKLPQASNGVEEFRPYRFPDQDTINKIYKFVPPLVDRIKAASAGRTMKEGLSHTSVAELVSTIRSDISKPLSNAQTPSSEGVQIGTFRQQEQQQQFRDPSRVQPAPAAPVETPPRTAPIAAGATEAVHSINGKIGTASIAINLADAAIKGDGTKVAEVGGTAVALEGGMKVVAKVAGVRAVPVAG